MTEVNGKSSLVDSSKALDRMLSFYLGKVCDELERAYPDEAVGVILITAIGDDPPVVLTNLSNGADVVARALRTMQRSRARMVST